MNRQVLSNIIIFRRDDKSALFISTCVWFDYLTCYFISWVGGTIKIYMQTQWYSEILNMNWAAHHGVKSHSHRAKSHRLWLLAPMVDIFVLIYPDSPLAEGGPVCIFRSHKFLLKFV